MGLDWIVGARPQQGTEQAGWAILRAGLANPVPAMIQAWEAIPKVDSWTGVGAPVVGRDAVADAWLVNRLRGRSVDAPVGELSQEEHEALGRNAGLHVLECAPPCDGIPVYSNAPMSKELELTSFRGQFLEDTVEMIGEELWDQAHTRMLPPEFERYTRALEAASATWVDKLDLAAVAGAYAPPDAEPGSPDANIHILASAARWCRYWVDRGHWLDVWF